MLSHSTHENKSDLTRSTGNRPRSARRDRPDQFFCATARTFPDPSVYHFAFLAISVALLGLGAGGVFAYLRRNWLARFETRRLAGLLCTINAISIFLTLEIVLHVPVSLELSRWNLLRLTAIYLTSTVPFLFTGLIFSSIGLAARTQFYSRPSLPASPRWSGNGSTPNGGRFRSSTASICSSLCPSCYCY